MILTLWNILEHKTDIIEEILKESIEGIIKEA
jgi:hypothetical protein